MKRTQSVVLTIQPLLCSLIRLDERALRKRVRAIAVLSQLRSTPANAKKQTKKKQQKKNKKKNKQKKKTRNVNLQNEELVCAFYINFSF
jgi:hypothetical protein